MGQENEIRKKSFSNENANKTDNTNESNQENKNENDFNKMIFENIFKNIHGEPNQKKEIKKEINNNKIENLNNPNFKGFTGGNNSNLDNENIEQKKSETSNEINKKKPNNLIKKINPRYVKKGLGINKKNNMINKLEKGNNLEIDIDKKNYISNNDPMMRTADNFHSKKISFNNNENKVKINNENNNEETIKKAPPINNIIKNFKNINIDDNINQDLLSNRKPIPKNILNENKIKQIKRYNMNDNFNTINNEENKNSINKRHKILIHAMEKEKPKKKIKNLNIEDNNNGPINNNMNINIEDDINQNININIEVNKKEDKKEEKNEDDDLDSNININNLIENKKSRSKTRNLEIKTNDENEENEFNPVRRLRRNNTYSNLNFESITPQKIFLFNNYSIFDSILLILNHNSYINQYLMKNKNKIYDWDKEMKCCLNLILCYINRYLWMTRPERIVSKEKLSEKYDYFLNIYLQNNDMKKEKESYFFNLDNLEKIIYFIYYRLNYEITNKSMKIRNYDSSDIKLKKFMNDFIRNNRSVISDNFTGFYVEETFCLNCQNRIQRYNYNMYYNMYNNTYQPEKNYSSFNYICIDLQNNNAQNNTNQFFRMSYNQNNYNQYNQYNNSNSIICLSDYLKKNYVRNILSPCNLCKLKTEKYIYKKFFMPPKILTIILDHNDGNFLIDDKIDLAQFSQAMGNINYNYYLVAMLCKYNHNNNYITYCFNYKEGKWYSFTNSEGIINRSVKTATFLEPNAIPYALFYQNIENMDFEYIEIDLNKANKKKEYLFKSSNGIIKKLFFGFETTVKEVKKEVAKYFGFDKVRLLINGDIAKDSDLLMFADPNNSPITVIQAPNI